jgi:hypothetical protein
VPDVDVDGDWREGRSRGRGSRLAGRVRFLLVLAVVVLVFYVLSKGN